MKSQFLLNEEQEIPSGIDGHLQFKLFAGEAYERKSPVSAFNKLFMVEIKSKTKQTFNIGDKLYVESGLYILEGAIESEGNLNEPEQLLVAKDSTLCEFTIKENSTNYIFGGDPFPEKRFNEWNFVSSSIELIEEAKQKCKNQSFGKIEGDDKDLHPLFNI